MCSNNQTKLLTPRNVGSIELHGATPESDLHGQVSRERNASAMDGHEGDRPVTDVSYVSFKYTVSAVSEIIKWAPCVCL
jgi:hypothetical protein